MPNRTTSLPDGYSTPSIQSFSHENPFAHLSDEQRRELARQIGAKAACIFGESLSRLTEAIKRHNPLELLATASFYCLLLPISSDHDFTKEGPHTQAEIEVLQSLCLQVRPPEFGEQSVLQHHLAEVLELTRQTSMTFSERRLAGLADADEDSRHFVTLQEAARCHTQVIRNWGFPQHMREITFELFEPLEGQIRSVIGISVREFFNLIDSLVSLSCRRAMDFYHKVRPAFRHKDVRNIVKEFCKLTDSPPESVAVIYESLRKGGGNVKAKKAFLLSYFHSFFPTFFTFNVGDCLKFVPTTVNIEWLRDLLAVCSLQFGDLEKDNPEHLLMQSPIQTRPLIRIGEEEYFVPVSGLFNSFFIEIVESLISHDHKLKASYERRRAKYLEDALLNRLEAAFPGCIVKVGTVGVSPIDGNNFENDCLVVIGPVALIFEAKSERVDDPTKRGAPGGLKKRYTSMVKHPADQTERFARLLESGQGIHEFSTRNHGKYSLDLSAIQRAVCITVTLDWIPAATLCWRHLIDSGMVEANQRPSVNLSFADLNLALEILSTPSQRLHYFWRRDEWERRVSYLADEEDLIVYYLSNGLPIHRDADGSPLSFNLFGNSDHLRNHYMAAWTDKTTNVPRPRRMLTPWWLSLIQHIEKLDLQEQWEILCVLLDMSFEAQSEFEKGFEHVVRKVREGGNDCGEDGIIACPVLSESNACVIGLAYRDINRDERDRRAKRLAEIEHEQSGRSKCVLIGRETSTCSDPYDFLALLVIDPN